MVTTNPDTMNPGENWCVLAYLIVLHVDTQMHLIPIFATLMNAPQCTVHVLHGPYDPSLVPHGPYDPSLILHGPYGPRPSQMSEAHSGSMKHPASSRFAAAPDCRPSSVRRSPLWSAESSSHKS